MESIFIRFLREKSHLLDDINNGFKLREHPISFKYDWLSVLPSLIEFWKSQNQSHPSIINIIDNFENLSLQNFHLWFLNELRNNKSFDGDISFLFVLYKAKIRMKCFTELIDNQKLHPHHKESFGKYGIALSHRWMMKNHGDRVIYISNNSEITNRIGRLLTMISSTAQFKHAIKSIFDLLSFTEISENSHEYEWRIVGNHFFGGKSYGDYPDIIPFSINDIEGIFVPKKQDVVALTKVLQEKQEREKSSIIPPIYLTDSVFLTKKEVHQINVIRSI